MNILEHLNTLAECAEARAQYAVEMAGYKRTELAEFSKAADQETATARGWRQLEAIVAGDGYLPHPDTITSADDVLGLTVGVLTIAPSAELTDEELAVYEELTHRIITQAIHQRQLVQQLRAARREATGQVVATSGPLATAPMPPNAAQPPAGQWAYRGVTYDLGRIYRDGDGDRWQWTGRWETAATGPVPLMTRGGADEAVQMDLLLASVGLEPVTLDSPADPYRPPEVTAPDPAQERVEATDQEQEETRG